ncbi:Sec-independent protein translocase protein TatB [Roseomonas gilardii]|uniref:Sec-independent protein translocase protein TatB n=1 Tax=Roseomonas gilardii TaxID=257708 RepID=UPI0004B91021|nr:Sec-independent protein translocase protein TatB [Roseomonas gilardii]SUE44211.1 Sec-independent protein translocase protein TatB [Roseomonas gilardii subsp. rosea]
MFDLAWSEIAVIVVVAIVVIGPKDLPDTIRTVAKGIGKLRRMAGELQGHLDEVVREAKLEDVRDQIREIRNFDIKGEIQRTVDKDGSLRSAFNDDPFRAQPATPSADAAPAVQAAPVGEATPAGAGTDATAVAADPDPARAADAPPSTAPVQEAAAPAGPGEAIPTEPLTPVPASARPRAPEATAPVRDAAAPAAPAVRTADAQTPPAAEPANIHKA